MTYPKWSEDDPWARHGVLCGCKYCAAVRESIRIEEAVARRKAADARSGVVEEK